MTIRAIEHVGITVPDLEQATTFFADAFGTVKIYDMIDAPLSGPGIESGLGEDSFHHVDEVGAAELQRRDVDRDGDARPGITVDAGAAQHPLAEVDDQP